MPLTRNQRNKQMTEPSDEIHSDCTIEPRGSPVKNKPPTPEAAPSEPKKISVTNFNNSLLRKSSANTSNQTDSLLRSKVSTFRAPSINGSTIEASKTFNILIAATGSVAAIKLVELIQKLKILFPQTFTNKTDGKSYRAKISIKVVMTENSKHFIGEKQIIESINDHSIDIHDDVDEWTNWSKMGDPVLHIELRKWADVMVIAPLDANTLAKIANGICDNLLTCVVRAWDTSKKLIYCPAMNVHMYNHPITREHLAKLQSFGYLRIECIEKRLACGDVGLGAMASVDTIVEKVVECLLQPGLKGISPTKPLLNQQPIYPIISNNNASSSPMKYPQSNNSLLDRFKTSSQVTLHAIGGSQRAAVANYGSSNMPINRLSLLQKQKPAVTPPMNLVLGRRTSLDLNSTAIPSIRTYSSRANLVTSLQNLQAVNSNDKNLPNTMDEDVVDLSTPEEDEEEFVHDDFDPANMMEQSLITDESIFSNEQTNNFPSQLNGSSLPSVSFDSVGQTDNVTTPVFNAQKFLALCHDKNRDCFTCAICKNDYKNRKSMARHLKEQHVQGNIFQCLSCGVAYKRREKLIKHNKERHGTDQLCKYNYMKPKSRQ